MDLFNFDFKHNDTDCNCFNFHSLFWLITIEIVMSDEKLL